MGLPPGLAPAEPVTAAGIASFPEPARRYLAFMGVLGRPRDWPLRADLSGRFRTMPGQAWMSMQAWQ